MPRVLKAALALAAVGLAGCAAQPAVVLPEDLATDRGAALEHHERLAREEDEALQLAEVGDCPGACEAGDRVCSLAERLCDIAARHPADEDLRARCSDGRSRCDHARDRLEAACGCAP